jgi:UDP:flavonoid glycosyltransferase YjiC (YdhE family)
MPTALLAWQLGSGLGHMLGLVPFARRMGADKSNRIYVAFRDLSRAATLFGKLGVKFLQAPAKTGGKLYFAKGGHYAHLLANSGFGNDHELFALASAWRNLFNLTRPDLVVFDHSPIALLASRGILAPDGRPARRVVIGNGFTTPPDVTPMPPTRSRRGITIDPAQVLADEALILRRVNCLLGLWSQPPLARLGQLYGDVDETFITNFQELDHCPDRPNRPRYWGPTNDSAGGAPPAWPTGTGPRIFAYLKPFAALTDLLQSLRDRKLPTLIYPDAIHAKVKRQFDSDTLRFATNRPDPTAAARECDFAILNATPGTTCDLLLAGKPILQIPIFGERQLMAEACERLGVSQTIWPSNASREQFEQTLAHLLANLHIHTKAAQVFAAKYADFDAQAQREKMLARTLELLHANALKPPASPSVPTEFALHYP